MRALVETIDVPGERLTPLVRASSDADVVSRRELDAIPLRRGARVINLVGPSSDPANAPSGPRLTRSVPDLREHDAILCASPGRSRAVKAALLAAGLPREELDEEESSSS